MLIYTFSQLLRSTNVIICSPKSLREVTLNYWNLILEGKVKKLTVKTRRYIYKLERQSFTDLNCKIICTWN